DESHGGILGRVSRHGGPSRGPRERRRPRHCAGAAHGEQVIQGAYVYNLGRVPYQEAWDLQRSLAAAVSQGAIPDTVLFLEHPPVITVGRRTEEGELHVPDG